MPKRFRNLSPAQEEAFGRIFLGEPPQASQRTLDVLLREGLIEQVERSSRSFRWYEYHLPIPVHMEYCAWAGENCSMEEDDAVD